MDWDDYKAEFEWDGSWRDLYILGADIVDWQKFIDFIRSSQYPAEFTINGEATDLPKDVADLFRKRGEEASLLSIDVAGVIINSHFFQDDEIEMDIDPREVSDAAKAEALFAFMKAVGEAIAKPVRLTPENLSSAVIFEYEPRTKVFRYERYTEPAE